MAATTDFYENNLTDRKWRGQTFTFPTTVHVALFTTATTDAGGGTEVTGGSYARVAVTCSLANWAGTQGAGTTVASTGTGGTTSNNNVITFASPTANWGTVTHLAVFDATTGGNMLVHGILTASKVINNGDAAPTIAAGALTIQEDD